MEKLPSGVLCLAIGHSIDDPTVIESYLADSELTAATEKCIPLALRDILASYSPNVTIPNARETVQYLDILWNPEKALEKASFAGLTHIVPYLLNRTVPSQRDMEQSLMSASVQGYAEIVHHLLSVPTGNTIGPFFLNKSLTSAVRRNYLDIAKELLTAGANPNFKVNVPIIIIAAEKGFLDIVKLLLSTGKITIDKNELFKSAVRSGNLELIDFLDKQDISGTPEFGFISAAEGNSISMMDYYLTLLSQKEINLRDLINPAMAKAVENDAVGAARYIRVLGYDVNDDSGDAFFHALERENPEMVCMLLSPLASIDTGGGVIPGADVHTGDDQALIDAVRNGLPRIVEVLLDAGANSNARNGLPLLASLVRSVGSRHPERNDILQIIALLLRTGATATDESANLVALENDSELTHLLEIKDDKAKLSDFIKALQNNSIS